tara:strand:+ start:462 stop:1097 length:636 start_codon:yes stop_codon:yes gene_type:complete
VVNYEINKIERKLLIIIYKNNLLEKNSLTNIQKQTDLDKINIINNLYNLKLLKLIKESNNKYFLTKKGRKKIKIVFTGGVYDIIHPGHIYTLKKSKQQGDFLIVSIARDERVKKNKGRTAINSERKRKTLVSSIKYVDHAVLGSKGEIFKIVKKIKPDIITIGYDQTHKLKKLRELVKKYELKIRIMKLDSPIPHVKSSYLIKNNVHKNKN